MKILKSEGVGFAHDKVELEKFQWKGYYLVITCLMLYAN